MAESSLSTEASGLDVTQDRVSTALAEPTRRVSLLFQVLLGLATAVVGLSSVTIYQIVLHLQVASFGISDSVGYPVVAGVGALASTLGVLVGGAISDRTTYRLGRRRTWIICGTICTALLTIGMAFITSLPLLAIVLALQEIAVNGFLFAPLIAIIVDQVPQKQRATASAFVGMAPLVGLLLGLFLVTEVAKSQVAASYFVLTVASVICIGLFLCILRDPPISKEETPPWSTFLTGMWVNPRRHSDFFLALVARFLIFLAYTTVVNFALPFLQEALHYEQLFPGQSAAQGVQIFQLVTTAGIILAAIVLGIISDVTQRRKVFVIGGSLIITLSLLGLAFLRLWIPLLLAAGILGIGIGAYFAVDYALGSQVLPDPRNRAKDMGIFNTPIFLSQVVSQVIYAIALNAFHSYAALFLIVAGFAVLSASLIIPIKSVR